MRLSGRAPAALQTLYRPPTQSQNRKKYRSVSIPKAFTLSVADVEALATRLGASAFRTRSFLG